MIKLPSKFLFSLVIFAGGFSFVSAQNDTNIARLHKAITEIGNKASATNTHFNETKLSSTGQQYTSNTSDNKESEIESMRLTIADRLSRKAQDIDLSVINAVKTDELRITTQRWQTAELPVMNKADAKRMVPNLKEGILYSKDINGSDGSYTSEKIKVAKDQNNDFAIRGIFGLNTPLIMTVDTTSGTVSMKAQQIYNHATYGPLYVCPVDIQANRYDPQGTLTGTLDSKGVVNLGAWGIFAIQGTYQGQALAVYSSTKWMPSNARITYTGPRETDNMTVEAVVEQELPNLINIYNIIDKGNVVSATLTPSKTVKMSPQMLYQAVAGYIYCYPVDLQNNKILYDQAINGSGSETSIKLNPWTAGLKGGGGSAYLFQTTDIVLNEAISFPSAVSGDFKGKGTQSDPYIIATAKDLQILSQKVNDGDDYINTYFSVTSDIDMKDVSATFIPIGDESSVFNGKINGNNHTISNFNYNGYGFSVTGLFGQLGSEAEIAGLNIKNANVKGSGKNVGILCGINKGRIENVSIYGTIISQGEATGTIAAQNEGIVSGTLFKGEAVAKGALGGLIGYNAGTIIKSHCNGTLILNGQYSAVYHHAGGLTGITISAAEGGNSISDSYFIGLVQDKSGYGIVSGLSALASNSVIERCFNAGTVQAILGNKDADTYTAGLIGWVSNSKVKNCFNSGNVVKTALSGLTSECVGGLFGYISISTVTSTAGSYLKNLSEISGCYNTGLVNNSFDNPVRGIYGKTFSGKEKEVEDLTFTSVYNDIQINPEDTTRYGRTTGYLTGATLPDGFDPAIWEAGNGCYPVLKSTKGTDGSNLAVASLIMSQDNSTIKLKKEATVAVKGNTGFYLFDGKKFTTETEAARITGNKLIVKDSYGNESFMFTDTDGNARMLTLQVVPAIYSGSGTESDPYLMKTVDDYIKLDNGVNKFGQRHRGDFFKMTNDIDFNGTDFHGIGYRNTSNEFEGVFDGDNHYVHNLTVETATLNTSGKVVPGSSVWHGAMFSMVGKQGIIRNLNIAKDCKFTVYHYGGALVGQLLGTVENCRNYADVTQYGAYAGGIAGVVRDCGTVSNSYNAGKIISLDLGAGGIAGYNIGTISYSQNDGEVIVNSTTSDAKNGGGISAYNSGTIDHCVNNANVVSPSNAGGISGEVSPIMNAGHFISNINNGIVMLTKDGAGIGGIIGYSAGTGNVTGNYYDASINVEGGVNGAGNPGTTGISTSELISGKMIGDLDINKYEFTEGMYPSLKKFKDEEAGKIIRSIYIKFGEGEVRNNINKSVELSISNGVTWTTDEAGKEYFSIEGNKLNVNIPTGMKLGKSTVAAKIGQNVIKEYPVLSLPVYLEGKGTEQDPYKINNREDFTKLSNFVHETGMDYKGVYFRLMNDIDFGGDSIPVIAGAPTNKSEVRKFQGKLDGNKKSISNFTFKCTKAGTYGGGKSVGIIGVLGEAGEVKNLISNGNIESNGLSGGIAGQCYGSIKDCENRSSVAATAGANGGIAGTLFAGGSISNCVNSGEIYTTHTYGCGGIVGESQTETSVTDCRNEGIIKIGVKGKSAGGIAGIGGGSILRNVNKGSFLSECVFSNSVTSQYIGGIVGRFASAPTEIDECMNEADITVEYCTTVGGIAGGHTSNRNSTNTLDIHDCINKGNITALGTIGGIVGYVPAGTQVYDCNNEGRIESSVGDATKTIGSRTTGTLMGMAGGIAGYVNATSATDSTRVFRCGNSGVVKSTVEYIGGIAAYTSSGSLVDKVFNTGEVICMSKAPEGGTDGNFISYMVGGIVGDLYGDLTNSWNSGKITADGHDIGGIAGFQGGYLSNCINLGNVEVKASAVNQNLSFHPTGGGVAGRGYRSITENCVNLGRIAAPDRSAGVMSMLLQSGSLLTSYNAGEVCNTNTDYEYLSNIANNKDAAAAALEKLYYLKDKNPHIRPNLIDNSKYAQALSETELMGADLGDGFTYTKASMPVPKGLYNPGLPHFTLAKITFEGENNSEENVTGMINIADLDDLVWTSSANIEITGSVALPRETGKGWIKVSTANRDYERTYNLNITKAVPTVVLPTSIILDKSAIEGEIDEEIQLSVNFEPENVTDNERILKWNTSNNKVCTVQDGKVRLIAPGNAVVTATTVNNLTASCSVKVKPVVPSSITLDRHSYEGIVGEQFILTATIDPENATDKSVTWSSDNEKVCIVTQEGKVTILSSGTAAVKATTVNGISDRCDITGISGIGQIYIDGKEVKDIIYYDLNGRITGKKRSDEVIIVKYIFTDGSTRQEKIMSSELR